MRNAKRQQSNEKSEASIVMVPISNNLPIRVNCLGYNNNKESEVSIAFVTISNEKSELSIVLVAKINENSKCQWCLVCNRQSLFMCKE